MSSQWNLVCNNANISVMVLWTSLWSTPSIVISLMPDISFINEWNLLEIDLPRIPLKGQST